MNERADVVAPGGSVGTEAQPRAMIHKKVLDVASAQPDASIETVADEVSGASATFVERVLDQFGDPGSASRPDASAQSAEETDGGTGDGSDDHRGQKGQSSGTDTGSRELTESTGPDGSTTGGDGPGSAPESPPASTDGGPTTVDDQSPPLSNADLTDTQRETLAVIHDQPTASQKEVGAVLGVSRATVSKRVNALPGFDWRDRRAYVEGLFGPVDGGTDDAPVDVTELAGGTDEASAGDRPDRDETAIDAASETREATQGANGDGGQSLEPLAARVASLERKLDGDTVADGGVDDVETLHKVVRVCVEADELDEDEERWVMGKLLGGT